MVMRLSTFVPVILSLLVSACQVRIPEDKDGAFTYAVEAVQHESYRRGADAAWVFLDSADPDDPRYDRGLRLLARSAEGLELPWAAGMLYREIAQRRQNMEIIPVALRGLKRIVESGVYDEDSLLTSFIAGEEFGDLPPDVQAFVSYYKGLDLLRHGYDAWAEANFSRIGLRGPYSARAEYARAVRLVAAGDFATATEKLVALRNRPDVDARLEADIERALARMAFEEQAYAVALKHYEAIRYLAPEDPEILLEMAWTYYYLGDSRKTLGLLVALNAPAYRRYISPERYLLEALALRRLCQFEAARHATVKLERRFAPSLAALDAGLLPREIPELRAAAGLRGQARGNTRWKESLEEEKLRLTDLELSPGLTAFLGDLYARGHEEALRRQAETLETEIANLTEELLMSQEGVRLIVHELGVALLRGRRKPEGPPEKPAVEVPISGDRVFFPFEGEYWTDELDDLIVVSEDRCIE